MSYETYAKLMLCLEEMEKELNKVAAVVGHPSYEEFYTEEKLQKAA